MRTEPVAVVINDGGGGGGWRVGTGLTQGGKVIATRRWSGCENGVRFWLHTPRPAQL